MKYFFGKSKKKCKGKGLLISLTNALKFSYMKIFEKSSGKCFVTKSIFPNCSGFKDAALFKKNSTISIFRVIH